eukprot:282857_1
MAQEKTAKVSSGEVVFIVGSRKVRCTALRGLLAIYSPIFRELFDKNTNDVIEMLDVDVNAFKIVLAHIEGNDVKKRINKETMCQVLYLSTKYILLDLSKISKKIMEKIWINQIYLIYINMLNPLMMII